jgi:hypothetical protein
MVRTPNKGSPQKPYGMLEDWFKSIENHSESPFSSDVHPLFHPSSIPSFQERGTQPSHLNRKDGWLEAPDFKPL